MSFTSRLFGSNAGKTMASRLAQNASAWAFPGLLTFGWLIWPALDKEWLQELGLAADPDADWKAVQAAKMARMEAKRIANGGKPRSSAAAEDEEEEEAASPKSEDEEEEEEEGAAAAPADEDEEEEQGGGDDDGDGDDDEEKEVAAIAPLYDPIKGKKLTKEEVWDNFTIKAINFGAEDDDEEEEEEEGEGNAMNNPWWKEAIVYQIYPRSFQDSDGNGVGDLRGVIERLDYIKSLGVDAVWLNPIFKSPNVDGGYDISDYYDIQPEFGTMADFDELLAGLHKRNLKLIIDLVLNHSSDKHEWFRQSRSSKTNPYRDYYFWKPGKGSMPPNNWPSFFGGSAWQHDDATDEYYLHLFLRDQPDLNWENPKLRNEVNQMMKFWLDKGVDGLRLDAISAISKRTSFPDTDTTDFNETILKFYSNGPRLREFIAESREKLWNDYNIVTVGEGPGIPPHNALDYLDEKQGLNMIFHFGHMFMDQGPGGRFDPKPWTMKEFKKVFKTWNETFATRGWGSVFLGNHDFSRMLSRWGNDKQYRDESAKLLLTLLLTMRGTPFIYMGDEIGMTNTELQSVSEAKDIETLKGWEVAREVARKQGITEAIAKAQFLKAANYAGRDNARTPMQWNSMQQAGFTTGDPWMRVNKNHTWLNVGDQENQSTSVLNYFRSLATLRKANPVFSYGSYQEIETSTNLFAYYRQWQGEKMLIILNFSDEVTNLPEEVAVLSKVKLTGNYSNSSDQVNPWEAAVYNCK